MTNVFGTPVYIFSADDPANRTGGKDEKSATVTNRLQEALKTMKPLDSARASLNKAIEALDGTAFEEIKQGISAVVQHITAAEQKIISQLGGADGVADQVAQMGNGNNAVPTAGQISGKEPLPEQSAAKTAPLGGAR